MDTWTAAQREDLFWISVDWFRFKNLKKSMLMRNNSLRSYMGKKIIRYISSSWPVFIILVPSILCQYWIHRKYTPNECQRNTMLYSTSYSVCLLWWEPMLISTDYTVCLLTSVPIRTLTLISIGCHTSGVISGNAVLLIARRCCRQARKKNSVEINLPGKSISLSGREVISREFPPFW